MDINLQNWEAIKELVDMKRKSKKDYDAFMKDLKEVSLDLGKAVVDAAEELNRYGEERNVKANFKKG